MNRKVSSPPIAGTTARLPGMAYQCLVTHDWPMLWMSDACETISGWTPEDFIEGRINWGDLIEPEHQEQVWQAVQQAMAADRPFQVTYTIRRRDGKVRWMWEQGYALKQSHQGNTVLEGLICDVTPQQQAFAEIERNNLFNQRVASTVPGHIFVLDIERRQITYSNNHFRNFGFEGVDGPQLPNVAELLRRMGPEDAAVGEILLERCRSLTIGEVVEWRYCIADNEGTVHRRWMRATPFETDETECVRALLCVVMDVTEQEETSDRLRDSLARFELIMDKASDGIFVCDAATRFTEVNLAGCQLLRMKREAILNSRLRDLVCTEELAQTPLDFTCAEADATLRLELNLRRGDGSRGDFELHARVLEDGALVAVIRDISERRRDMNRRLEIERNIAEAQRFATLRTISLGIAHDFNNLLATILGSAETLLEQPEFADLTRQKIERIRLASARASELTHQLLDAAGGGSSEMTNVDVGEMIREMPALLHSALGSNVTLKLDVAAKLPPVEGDAARLRQVLMNLVVNASEAIGAGAGQVTLTVAVASAGERQHWSITPPPSDTQKFIKVVVSDDGEGISAAKLPTIFDPYVSSKGPGRGLGLAAVRGIVRQHQGDLVIHSQEGRGTQCELWLPAAVSMSSRAASGTWRRRWRGSGRVLLVDDEDGPRAALRELIEAIGFEVTDVQSGFAALDVLKTDAAAYAAVVLDVSMPGIDGVATWREIAKRWRAIPVVLMSGMSSPELGDPPDGGELPGFLLKPFSMKQLRVALYKATGEHRS